MTVHICLPVYRDCRIVGIVQKEGVLDGEVVRLPDGTLVDAEGWKPTPSQAWEACGEEILAVAQTLLNQADGCRVRANEEACS